MVRNLPCPCQPQKKKRHRQSPLYVSTFPFPSFRPLPFGLKYYICLARAFFAGLPLCCQNFKPRIGGMSGMGGMGNMGPIGPMGGCGVCGGCGCMGGCGMAMPDCGISGACLSPHQSCGGCGCCGCGCGNCGCSSCGGCGCTGCGCGWKAPETPPLGLRATGASLLIRTMEEMPPLVTEDPRGFTLRSSVPIRQGLRGKLRPNVSKVKGTMVILQHDLCKLLRNGRSTAAKGLASCHA